MAIDFDKLSATAKDHYIKIGRSYGSETTLAQADATIGALGSYSAQVAAAGFTADDAAKLTAARDGLLAAGVQRTAAQVTKTTQRGSNAAALREGKAAREAARSVLLASRDTLLEDGSDAALAAIATLDVAIEKTQRSGGSLSALAQQLTVLRDALASDAIAAATAQRGGPTLVTRLTTSIGALDMAPRAIKPGTAAETERLDLLDGIIVSLCRSARRAARAAAKTAGSPALAHAFALDALHGHASAEAPAPPAAPAAPPPAAPPVPAPVS